jgi:hypothetical protein
MPCNFKDILFSRFSSHIRLSNSKYLSPSLSINTPSKILKVKWLRYRFAEDGKSIAFVASRAKYKWICFSTPHRATTKIVWAQQTVLKSQKQAMKEPFSKPGSDAGSG